MGISKQFSPEFKREAVQILESGSRPASELARELGIPRNRLYKWQTELRARGSAAFPGSGLRTERTTRKKSCILELYLNVAEWGYGIYGAEAASRHHFGKPSLELTSDEAAWLAAILPSPRRYDPLRKTTFLTRRHERILKWVDRQPTSATPVTEE